MSTRKIVYAPRLGYLVACPAGYDADAITREDAAHDTNVCSAVAELAYLRNRSLATAQMAIDTAQTDDAREAFVAAADALRDAWTTAVEAVRSEDEHAIADAREALQTAQRIASEGGSDIEERKALALFD